MKVWAEVTVEGAPDGATVTGVFTSGTTSSGERKATLRGGKATLSASIDIGDSLGFKVTSVSKKNEGRYRLVGIRERNISLPSPARLTVALGGEGDLTLTIEGDKGAVIGATVLGKITTLNPGGSSDWARVGKPRKLEFGRGPQEQPYRAQPTLPGKEKPLKMYEFRIEEVEWAGRKYVLVDERARWRCPKQASPKGSYEKAFELEPFP